MAGVELTAAAVDDLDRLVVTHTLPEATRARVHATLLPLRQFPRMGAELPGRWSVMRFVLGPWRWMLIVYAVMDDDRVVVLTFQDARSSIVATTG